MKYPAFIKEGSTIGICAPSFGVPFDPYRAKYEEGKRKLIDHGFKIKESPSVYNLEKAQSNTPQIRAKEFMDLYLDEEVDLIMSVAGGEIMCEILPFIDFDKIKNSKPKYFMGYSDNTNLTFTLTTICDLVSIYGACVTNYGTYDLDKSLIESIEMISGNLFKQEMGQSIMSFLQNIRIGHAKMLLRKFPEKDACTIGKICGFNSASYFGKVFKKVTGLTPGMYRQV